MLRKKSYFTNNSGRLQDFIVIKDKESRSFFISLSKIINSERSGDWKYSLLEYIAVCLKSLEMMENRAGTKIPNISILLPVEQSHIQTPTGEKMIKIAGR